MNLLIRGGVAFLTALASFYFVEWVGGTDQSHLISEFRRLGMVTPE